MGLSCAVKFFFLVFLLNWTISNIFCFINIAQQYCPYVCRRMPRRQCSFKSFALRSCQCGLKTRYWLKFWVLDLPSSRVNFLGGVPALICIYIYDTSAVSVEVMYQALCDCQILHPDPDDDCISEEDDGKSCHIVASHWQLSHMARLELEPGSGERQLAVNGNRGLATYASSMSFGHPDHYFLTVWTPKSWVQDLLMMTISRW